MPRNKNGAVTARTQPARPHSSTRREATGQRPSTAGRRARRLGTALLLGLLAFPVAAQGRGGRRPGNETPGAAAPLLIVDRSEIDLGELPKGSSAEARFVLRNAGDAPLRLLDVGAGCACTVAAYDEVIPPGEAGHLTITLLTQTLYGEVAQGISIMTNDPANPAVFLVVKADVVTAVRIIPETPIELRNAAGPTRVRRVVRRSMNSGPGFFNLVGLRSSVPWISARARKVRASEPESGELPAVEPGDWILEIGLEGQPAYGRRSETVEFKTGLDRQPLVTLDVHADLEPPVLLPVERLFLQPRDGGAGETTVLTVREGLDPGGLRVEASPAGLGVKLEPEGGRSFRATVRWKGGRLDDGTLTFHVGGERFELLVLYAE